ncbi:UDP-N-acetylglucosamine 1-carboxyvinyltransferase 1 [uncultured Clostridium sp.]|uniref:UDP-N-acetylglucosamine 1-carboxyvinyltransferase n=1 Tax=uncultured Clostridium sp. TaxID=59620 RepID=UPI000821C500|nr:UDP-N-acetylglucosamine 1-carboxyvinyltransferase [uncultured Clostridium sp.]SCK04666.1 UDP-N-acetylglucosamine 1-carboxyvinyltransferase 1 [uncultured Clostridium sp.]
MEKIIVKGGNKLQGEVDISIAKNSVLPIIVATILNPRKITIKKVPLLEDVLVLVNLLRELECSVEFSDITGDLIIDTSNLKEIEPSNDLIKRMRASFLIVGPMLARFGRCKISMPGGCNIGSRPVDLHLKGFKKLGVDIESGHGYINTKTEGLKGERVYLDFPSVGATENLMMAAVCAEGVTIIENAAEEPEIWDLARFLNSMGAKVEGAGYGRITITGVKELKETEAFTPIYDRIEAGTFIVAAAITKSKITINGVNEEHLMPSIEKLTEVGVKFKIDGEKMLVDGTGDRFPVDIKTLPYPGFPTDMQPQMMALLSLTNGVSVITETVFENRFMHVGELVRMGANIKIDGRIAIVEGVKQLTGCEVKATDLRAGAAMILAGLVANGETVISEIHHIDRGYTRIEDKFNSLGANVHRIKV